LDAEFNSKRAVNKCRFIPGILHVLTKSRVYFEGECKDF
jgi:hypothetical protein